jgi:hypothetical protein
MGKPHSNLNLIFLSRNFNLKIEYGRIQNSSDTRACESFRHSDRTSPAGARRKDGGWMPLPGILMARIIHPLQAEFGDMMRTRANHPHNMH